MQRQLLKLLPIFLFLSLSACASLTHQQQADELQQQLQNNNIPIFANSNDIKLILPASMLGHTARKPLNQLVHFLHQHPTMNVEVIGFTDNRGSHLANIMTSEKRAKDVAGYIIDHGIHAHRVTTKGYGSKDPIADNHTFEGREQNRRVEIYLIDQSDDFNSD